MALEVYLRLAASRHPVEKAGGEDPRGEAAADLFQRGSLSFVQRDAVSPASDFSRRGVSAGDLLFGEVDEPLPCKGPKRWRRVLDQPAKIADRHRAPFPQRFDHGGLLRGEFHPRGDFSVQSDPFLLLRPDRRTVQALPPRRRAPPPRENGDLRRGRSCPSPCAGGSRECPPGG